MATDTKKDAVLTDADVVEIAARYGFDHTHEEAMAEFGSDLDGLRCFSSWVLQKKAHDDASKADSVKFKIGPSGTIVATGFRRMGASFYLHEWKLLAGAKEGDGIAHKAVAWAESQPKGDDGKPLYSTGKGDSERFKASKAKAKAEWEAKQQSQG